MKYTFILSFGCLTSDDKLASFKFFLECGLIPFKLHTSNDITQFVFHNISDADYQSVKDYYYTYLYDKNTLYDVNNIMFQSYDNYKEE